MTFWTSLATYCNELAPVMGPLFSALGELADAIQRANHQTSPAQSALVSDLDA